jgi:6-phosphogluconate dehydrogenase
MQLGMIGLGKMGRNMTLRLLRGGHQVAVYDTSPEAVSSLATEGALGSSSIAELARNLPPPRIFWIMVPSKFVDSVIAELESCAEPGDILVDGGNSFYKDSIGRAERLAKKGLWFLDCGTSGGVWGLENGYCLMTGGDEQAAQRLAPIFATLAPTDGWLHCGPSGAGHFVKMVHNGIEYGMMQAYAEGFELMAKCAYELDLERIARLWMQGSVVRSWLLELAGNALAADPQLKELQPYVEDSGEGRWTVDACVEFGVPGTVLAHSLFARFASRDNDSFALKMLAALRNQFGGHAVRERS